MHIIRRAIVAFIFFSGVSCNDSAKKEAGTGRIQIKDTSVAHGETRRNPYSSIDVSPMDMSYFPIDYPKLKMTGAIKEPPVARVIYSRPHLQGRELFHGLLNYNEPWRLGANESTEIQLYKEVSIQNRRVNEGRYTLYCIPHESAWTIAFNKNIDTWGLKPDSTQDAYRFEVPVKKTDNHIEYYTMVFEKAGGGADLLMAWDNVEVRLRLNFR